MRLIDEGELGSGPHRETIEDTGAASILPATYTLHTPAHEPKSLFRCRFVFVVHFSFSVASRIPASSADFLHFRRSNNKKLAGLRTRQPEQDLATGPLSFQSLTSSGAAALLTRVQVTSQWLLSTGCTSVFLHPARLGEGDCGRCFQGHSGCVSATSC